MKKSKIQSQPNCHHTQGVWCWQKSPRDLKRTGISKAAFYKWRQRYGGMTASGLKRGKDLEEENAKLKRMYAELTLDLQAVKCIIEKRL